MKKLLNRVLKSISNLFDKLANILMGENIFMSIIVGLGLLSLLTSTSLITKAVIIISLVIISDPIKFDRYIYHKVCGDDMDDEEV